MRVCLPFSPDRLVDVPDVFEYTVADATQGWSAAAAQAEFYVPAYRFDRRPIDVIADMPDLTVVQTLTAGYEHFLPIPDGVTLCNATGVHDAATSELAMGLMIAAQRDFSTIFEGMRRHTWTQAMTSSLADKRVLVVGAGAIARALQRRLDGFECAVTLVGRSAREGVHAWAELSTLLPEADIVVLLVPLTDETRGMVDKEFLAAMPDGGLLVNVARGGVVVTDDLLAELGAGRLRAALDVTDPEPLPSDHPLWGAPGVIISHHRGGASEAMWPRAHRLVAAQLQRIADGRPLLNVVAGTGQTSLSAGA
jgi:phosphoglycerate dehydrogenase-like enzyme